MFSKPVIVTLISVIAFGSVFVSSDDAGARSLTEIARKDAIQAHRNAGTFTQRAAAFQGRLPGEQAAYVKARKSTNGHIRNAARLRFLRFLGQLQTKLGDADRAHVVAIQKYQYYNRVSKTSGGNASIAALSGARSRFAATLANVAATIASVRTQR